ncbi:MAG TPA: tRNA pseudouridine(55) synthase TruB [Candidatus Methylomirabilis sp.]|nr:tRNA pseudouridine(55) synthase TruB [Candidatus Methylomirabilis sp.]
MAPERNRHMPPPTDDSRHMVMGPEVHGVLNINKPSGMTSHDVVDAVRKILGVRRVGHTGTLDPQATGVLPLCVGRATRIAQYLTQADKEYMMTLCLGVTTDTLDATGKETGRVQELRVHREDVLAILPRFIGEIQQVPPLFSAKKYRGERLYRLARRGELVERQPVTVRVYTLELLAFALPFVTLKLGCSKGTYARSLCDDIGRVLGCGGHLHALTRTRSGRFGMDGILTLETLEQMVRERRVEEVLIPIADALAHLPAVRVAPEAGRVILHGSDVAAAMVVQFPAGLSRGALVRVLGYRKQLLSLAETMVASLEFPACDPPRVVLHPVRVFSAASGTA